MKSNIRLEAFLANIIYYNLHGTSVDRIYLTSELFDEKRE